MLAEVESIVNNCPITAVSDDPADFTALKPNHFIAERRSVKPGNLVRIAEDNVVRNRWPLGCVVEVFTGKVGCVRSSRSKTAGGVFHCPITKICLLEEVIDGT